MKKLSLIALLIVAMMLSLAGCSKKTDYQLYSEAQKNATEAKYADYSGEATLSLKMGDTISVNMPVNYALKIDATDKNAPKMLLEYTTVSEIFGKTETSVSVYTEGDGTTYTATKIKVEDEEEVTKIKTNSGEISGDTGIGLPKFKEDAKIDTDIFTEEDFKDIQKEDVDGGIKYTITKTGAQIKEIVIDVLNNVINAMDITDDEKNEARKEIENSLNDTELGDVTVKFVIKDGYITDVEIEMADLKTTDKDSGMKMTVSIKASIKLNNPGKEVEVKAPYDLGEYQEYQVPDFDFGEDWDM